MFVLSDRSCGVFVSAHRHPKVSSMKITRKVGFKEEEGSSSDEFEVGESESYV